MVFGRLETIHLLHELGDNAPMSKCTSTMTRRPCTKECVDLVKKNNTRRYTAGKGENRPDQFLAFAEILLTELSERDALKTIKITLSSTSEGFTAIMRHPTSLARALTTRVFPVPGGPNNRRPFIP
jgi:hypothetical protein